jgi:hypothetical protein
VTAVPPISFGASGFSAPAEPDILTGVQTDIDAAFGGGVNPALETPQGQLSTSLAAAIGNQNDALLEYFQSVDPNFAAGRMQDALGRIYFLTRQPARATKVTATCTGVPGTNIPSGAFAIADDNNYYAAALGGTIGGGGTVDLEFDCVAIGPIECPTGSLSRIFQAISGWDAITNAADGIVGADIESRYAFENRRRNSVAANALGTNAALRAAVLLVSGVTDCYVTDNPLGTTEVVGGVTLAAHSLYVAVVGGIDLDVATAIWSRKDPGCDYNGSTHVTVYDTSYGPPQPSYTVSFQRAVGVDITFVINVAPGPDVPANAIDLIKSAIEAAFIGLDGGPRTGIGRTVFAGRFFAPVQAIGSWVTLTVLTVNGGASVPVNINEYPALDPADITVTVS